MRLFAFTLFIICTSCVTYIPVSSNEKCASDGQVLTGSTFGNAEATAWTTAGPHGTFSRAQGFSAAVSCRPPINEKEKCEASAHSQAFERKSEFNSSVDGKRFLTGTGYFFYVLPGVALNWYYSGQKSSVESAAHALATESLNRCVSGPEDVRLPTSN